MTILLCFSMRKLQYVVLCALTRTDGSRAVNGYTSLLSLSGGDGLSQPCFLKEKLYYGMK